MRFHLTRNAEKFRAPTVQKNSLILFDLTFCPVIIFDQNRHLEHGIEYHNNKIWCCMA